MERYIAEADVYKLVEPMGTARVHCAQIDALPRADVAPKSEWISVEERLPESEGKYLVCTSNGNIGVGNFIDYYGTGKHLCFDIWAVTHWMPLPEPPKGE